MHSEYDRPLYFQLANHRNAKEVVFPPDISMPRKSIAMQFDNFLKLEIPVSIAICNLNHNLLSILMAYLVDYDFCITIKYASLPGAIK